MSDAPPVSSAAIVSRLKGVVMLFERGGDFGVFECEAVSNAIDWVGASVIREAKLTLERDEARREICNIVSSRLRHGAISPEDHAEANGWDCFAR